MSLSCPDGRSARLSATMKGDSRHILAILAVEDIAASIAFYRAAFGWTPAVETPVYIQFTLAGGQRVVGGEE